MTQQEDRQRTKERAQERKAKAEARDQVYCPAFITIDPPKEGGKEHERFYCRRRDDQ